jgi:hypothetical protein
VWYNKLMPMTQQEYEDKETMISRAVAFTLELGHFNNAKYEMYLTPGTHDIKVRDRLSGILVAYSSTKADFENSLVEFAADYFA